MKRTHQLTMFFIAAVFQLALIPTSYAGALGAEYEGTCVIYETNFDSVSTQTVDFSLTDRETKKIYEKDGSTLNLTFYENLLGTKYTVQLAVVSEDTPNQQVGLMVQSNLEIPPKVDYISKTWEQTTFSCVVSGF